MDRPRRKRVRLPEYDYSSPGAYFITICTQDRRCILSCVRVGAGVLDGPQLQLTEIGRMIDKRIQEMNVVYSDRTIEKYVIMPNHVHMLVTITGGGPSRTPAPTNAWIPAFVSTFKRYTNRDAGRDLWQRSYYEHVARDEKDYLSVWQYIEDNPTKWAEDEYFNGE